MKIPVETLLKQRNNQITNLRNQIANEKEANRLATEAYEAEIERRDKLLGENGIEILMKEHEEQRDTLVKSYESQLEKIEKTLELGKLTASLLENKLKESEESVELLNNALTGEKNQNQELLDKIVELKQGNEDLKKESDGYFETIKIRDKTISMLSEDNFKRIEVIEERNETIKHLDEDLTKLKSNWFVKWFLL